MRFRLTTSLLLIAIIAIFTNWYAERQSRRVITGQWYWPTQDVGVLGYWETLTLNRDGTFEKVQQYRMGQETYSGTYMCNNDGTYSFDVSKKVCPQPRMEGPGFVTYEIRKGYTCRCAIDDAGYLVVTSLQEFGERTGDLKTDDCNLKWHCYSPYSHEKQSEFEQQKIDAIIEQLNN